MSAQTKPLVSINFEITANPMVSVFDRSFMFGDSVYEVLRTYAGKLFTFEEHFARLQRSAEKIYLKLPFSDKQLRRHLEDLVAKVNQATPENPTDCYLRIIVTRGNSEPSIEPPSVETPLTVVMVKPLKGWPKELYDRGLHLAVPKIRRNPRVALDPMIKSGNYLNSILAVYQARQMGADDAVMLNPEGIITEMSNANVFFVKDGVLLSPTNDDSILDGITRNLVFQIAESERIPCKLRSLTMDEARQCQECFISSTTREVMPVRQLDDIIFKVPGPITDRLAKAYKSHLQKRLGL